MGIISTFQGLKGDTGEKGDLGPIGPTGGMFDKSINFLR